MSLSCYELRGRFRVWGGGIETTGPDYTLDSGRACASHFHLPHVRESVADGLDRHVSVLAGTEAISAFEATVRELVGSSVSTGR
jgi:hypothetical protein